MSPAFLSVISVVTVFLFMLYYLVKARSRIETIHLLCFLYDSPEERFPSFAESFKWIRPYFYGERSWSELSNKELGNRVVEDLRANVREVEASGEEPLPEVKNLIIWAFMSKISNSFFGFCSIIFVVVGSGILSSFHALFVAGRCKKVQNTAEKIFRGCLFDLALRA